MSKWITESSIIELLHQMDGYRVGDEVRISDREEVFVIAEKHDERHQGRTNELLWEFYPYRLRDPYGHVRWDFTEKPFTAWRRP